MEFCQGTVHQDGICLLLLMVCVFSSHFEQAPQQWNYRISALLGMFFQGADPSATSPVLSCFPHPIPGEVYPYQATEKD